MPAGRQAGSERGREGGRRRKIRRRCWWLDTSVLVVRYGEVKSSDEGCRTAAAVTLAATHSQSAASSFVVVRCRSSSFVVVRRFVVEEFVFGLVWFGLMWCGLYLCVVVVCLCTVKAALRCLVLQCEACLRCAFGGCMRQSSVSRSATCRHMCVCVCEQNAAME